MVFILVGWCKEMVFILYSYCSKGYKGQNHYLQK